MVLDFALKIRDGCCPVHDAMDVRRLTNAGVSDTGPNRVKTGDEIAVIFHPAFSGATVGFLRRIVLPDKKEVEFAPTEAR